MYVNIPKLISECTQWDVVMYKDMNNSGNKCSIFKLNVYAEEA